MASWVQCMYKVVEHDGHTDFGPEHWKRAYENLNHYKHPAEYINMHQLLGQYEKYVKLRQRCRDITFFVKLKYNLLQQTLNGPFNTPHNIDTLISLFGKSQRTYLSFARFAQLWKVKHSQLRIEIDLCLNPIMETDANTTTIYEFKANLKQLDELNKKLALAKANLKGLATQTKTYAGLSLQVDNLTKSVNTNKKGIENLNQSA